MKSLDQNLAAALQAIRQVKAQVTKGASNRRADRLKEAGGIDQVHNLLRNATTVQSLSPNSINVSKGVQNKASFFVNKFPNQAPTLPPPVDKSFQTALKDGTLINEVDAMRKTYTWPKSADILDVMMVRDEAIKARCGNCHEQACVAYYELYCRIPAEVDCIDLMTFGDKSYDHVWVVIGRVGASDLKSLATWGPTAVWCDPWQSEGVAFAVQDLVKGKVRNLDAIYKCNTAEMVAMGNPKSLCRDGSLAAPSATKLDASRFAAFS